MQLFSIIEKKLFFYCDNIPVLPILLYRRYRATYKFIIQWLPQNFVVSILTPILLFIFITTSSKTVPSQESSPFLLPLPSLDPARPNTSEQANVATHL